MLAPRVVVVHRRTELEELVDRHGTRGQAEFFLRGRGRDLAAVQRPHDADAAARQQVAVSVPGDWRRGTVERADLDRFRFEDGDVVVVVGQDGLVANVAKYLAGQPVVGVNPDPERNPGVLVRHPPDRVARLLADVVAERAGVERRTMVAAKLDDGQTLLAVNEIFAGHSTHQSARYTLTAPGREPERQSSSGVIVGTGTGATGWCASLVRGRAAPPRLPSPADRTLAWFVREAWPSPSTGTSCVDGLLAAGDGLELAAETDGLVVFGDGLEADRLVLSWGQQLRVGVADATLCLVTG
ncbi:ATP-NAD kinase [Jiangella alkaliphila]|uniref:ATP-NAD kinase n=2 Tax=Jiangella alkaliphila TaxID=419479 RepID=A0A1H2H6A7_9ACTN|nr:hypothetical protein [Jiangella alkaliphila]SDU27342.1 ATP-NAD kinase [Jiangella alkaliphila]